MGKDLTNRQNEKARVMGLVDKAETLLSADMAVSVQGLGVEICGRKTRNRVLRSQKTRDNSSPLGTRVLLLKTNHSS